MSSRSEGFASLKKHYENGTSEIRYLLETECSVLYECKWCREIFRSILTFTSHKRSLCRSMFGDLSDELELAKKFQKRQRDERGEIVGPSKQGRVNLEAVLDERSRPVTVTLPHSKKQMEIMTLPKTVTKAKPVTEFVGGYQRLIDMPTGMAISSQIPDDRVVVVMPQEKSSRYGEMQLRNRRVDERYATFSNEQLKILQRIPDDILMFAEISNFQCKHSQCNSYRPFDSFEALTYHLILTHHSANEDGHRCYFCDSKTYNTFEKLKNHLKLKHGLIRKNHLDARKKLARRSYKRVHDHEHRSISPISYADNEDAVESDNELDNGPNTNSPAPFLDSPIKLEEPDIVNDSMPTLKRIPVRRGRRQKGRGAAAKPTLSPAKIRQLPFNEESQGSSGAVEFNIGNIDEFLNIRSNENSLSNQAKKAKTNSPAKKSNRLANDELSQASSSTGSSEIKEEEEIEDGQKEIDVEQLMETDSGEPELDEGGEPSVKRRKPVSLIKGRTPRQRVQVSRLSQDYVVPKKYATTTKMLSENQFRAFAKEQAKQFKKDKRTRRKRKLVPLDSSQSTIDPSNASPNEGDSGELKEGSSMPTRKRGPYKRKLVSKEPKSQSKCSSDEEDEDEIDNATQRLIQQVKNSLTKGSTPIGDQPGIKKEDSSSLGTSSCPSPELIAQEGFILPPLSTAKGASSSQYNSRKEDSVPPSTTNTIRSGSTNASPMKTVFPSIMTGSEMELLNYSPRAKPTRQVLTEVSDETRGEAASRRKQNFADKNGENDAASDLKLVQMPGQQPFKPDDLTLLPVTLNTSQRRMLFGPLKPLYIARGGTDGLHQCAECGCVCKTLAEGHKHMVSHVRMIRLKCSLCDAGSFFCTDMRKHLMYRYCENLHYAPSEMISPGTPCMDALTADKLIRITCTQNPGQTTFTKGKIISAEKPTPYFPDPRIEQRLLGSLRSVMRASPRKIVLTSRKKSPTEESQQSTSMVEDSQSGESQPTSSQTFNGDDQGDYSSKDSTPPITTNDLLNQAESIATSQELLIPHDNGEKRDNPKYTLPLTIRANPPIQKTPSPDPLNSEVPSAEIILVDEPAQNSDLPQSDSAELPIISQSSDSQQSQKSTNSIRSNIAKPSILSRSPVKISTTDQSATSITTPAFQPQSETMIVDTIEQMQAPSDQSTTLTTVSAGEKLEEKSPEVNPSSTFNFASDQPRIIVTDENQ